MVNTGIDREKRSTESKATGQPVTQPRQLEPYQKWPEDLFKTIFNNSPIGIYIVADGKFQFVNPRFQEVTGYAENELLGTNPLKLVHPDDRAVVRQKAVKMLKGESSTEYEYRVNSKYGETKWISETVTSIQYQGGHATLGHFIDSTKRKRTEEALRESEKRFRDLAELLPETVFEMDAEGNLSFANEAAHNIFGISPEDFDTGLPVLQIIIPEDRDRARDNMQRLLNGEKLGGIEYTGAIQCRTGAVRLCRLS